MKDRNSVLWLVRLKRSILVYEVSLGVYISSRGSSLTKPMSKFWQKRSEFAHLHLWRVPLRWITACPAVLRADRIPHLYHLVRLLRGHTD